MKTMPVLPMENVLLPGMLVHLDIVREMNKKTVEAADKEDDLIFIATEKDLEEEHPEYEDLYPVGVIAKIRQQVRLKNNVIRIMVSIRRRARLVSLDYKEDHLEGQVESYEIDEDTKPGAFECEAMCRDLKRIYERYLDENPRAGQSGVVQIEKTDNLEKLVDLIAMHITMSSEKRQEVLECQDLEKRYEIVGRFLMNEITIGRLREQYHEKVKESLQENQREYFLREQLKQIREELGEEQDSQYYTDKYKNQLEQIECSDEIRGRIEKEIDRLESIPVSSSEHVVAADYIETLLALPWDRASHDSKDIKKAQEILEEDHYGLDKIKERILEFLAVRILNEQGDSPILCLVGPPGTGKTSIAKSVARALNKEYVRICLGGVRDEAEIRGHRRTYVGAMPGRFIDGIRKAGVKNPLILLDEIDKVGKEYRGDTSAALLEVLDPEQNSHFIDHYVDMPVDLSQAMFLCTANSLDTIPRPLLDRMEILSLSGYTENERFHIGKKYLVPKQMKKNGLDKAKLRITDGALKEIISGYTKEAGVRELERQIASICRKSARKILDGTEEKIQVTARNLTEFLGRKKYSLLEANKRPEIGIVRGLAWTQVGGDTLEIEVNTMPGSGKLIITGKLGDVMKESAQIAMSLMRSLLPKQDKFVKAHDFHLHVPEGAVPKDGPSAGVTMTTAFYSAVSGRKVDPKVAMTGEITLRGKVLAIGGLKEKLLAASMAGIKTVIVPFENKSTVEELEPEILGSMEVVYAKTIRDVLKVALVTEG